MPTQNAPTNPAPHRFTPSRGHLAAAAFFCFFTFIAAGRDLWVYIFLVIPAVLVWWALRSSTTVHPTKGIAARYAFSKPQSMTWEEFDKLRFEKSKTFAVAHDGHDFALPAVTFNNIPQFAAASGGHVPDAYTEGYEAAKDKVRIVTKDGRQVLVSKEEAAEREKKEATRLEAQIEASRTKKHH